MSYEKLRKLNSRITKCVACPRLAHYIRQIGREKVRRFAGGVLVWAIAKLGRPRRKAADRGAWHLQRTAAFGHGVRFDVGGRVLLASYHPSRQNMNTGRLTWQMWIRIFRRARAIIENNRA